MQSGKALDQLSAQQIADLRPAGQVRRQSVADHHSRTVFDDLKRRAEHACLVAEQHRPRRQRILPPQGREDAVFARHIVAAIRQRPGRRPAQYRRLAVNLDQIVEISVAAGKLPRQARSEHDATPCEIACQRSPILRDAVRSLNEFPRVRRHSINAAIDMVSRFACPDRAHGSGDGNAISYLKRVGGVWDISS